MGSSSQSIPWSFDRQEWTNRLLFLSLAVSLLAVLWIQLPRLIDNYRVDEDFRNFYWMIRFRDQTLFENDPLIYGRVIQANIGGFHLDIDVGSLGYSLLFYGLSSLIWPVWQISKLLPFFLMPLAIYYIFKLGVLIKGNIAGVILSLLFIFFNLSSTTAISVLSGLQRGFVCPLLLAYLYYLIKQHYLRAAFFAVLSSSFYPPTFFIAVLTYLLSFVKINHRISWHVSGRKVSAFLIGVILGLAFLMPAALQQFSPFVAGETETNISEAAHLKAIEHSDYQRGGRRELISDYPLIGRLGLVSVAGEAVHIGVLLGIMIVMYAVMRDESLQFSIEIWYLLLSGLLLFAISLAFFLLTFSFGLYLPSRYTQCTLFLFSLIFVGLNLPRFVSILAASLVRNGKWLGVTFICLGVGLVLFVLLLPQALVFPQRGPQLLGQDGQRIALAVLGILSLLFGGWSLARGRGTNYVAHDRLSGQPKLCLSLIVISVSGLILVTIATIYMRAMSDWYLILSADERALHRFLITVPKSSLLAGDPNIMSNVPLFGERQVLFAYEFPGSNSRAIEDFFDAYYAESSETLGGFCQEYGVDYLVVNQEQFSPNHLAQGHFFYVPYNESIAQTVATRSNFVLSQIPDSRKAFQSGPLFVVKCDEEAFANLD